MRSKLLSASRWGSVCAVIAAASMVLAGSGSGAVAAGDQAGSPAYQALVDRLLTLRSAGAAEQAPVRNMGTCRPMGRVAVYGRGHEPKEDLKQLNR
jgi:hypothetical protein